jgi:hypothetical protein
MTIADPTRRASAGPLPVDLSPLSGSLVERILFNNRFVVLLLCALATLLLSHQARHLS